MGQTHQLKGGDYQIVLRKKKKKKQDPITKREGLGM
jgi:hypothetical protein